MADAKHPCHEDAVSAVKASRTRLKNEAESRKKEVKQGTFTTKKVKTLPDDAIAPNLETESASALKIDYGLAAWTALQNVQQELASKEVEQWVRSKLENSELREKLDIQGKTAKGEDNQELKKEGLKLNIISRRRPSA